MTDKPTPWPEWSELTPALGIQGRRFSVGYPRDRLPPDVLLSEVEYAQARRAVNERPALLAVVEAVKKAHAWPAPGVLEPCAICRALAALPKDLT